MLVIKHADQVTDIVTVNIADLVIFTTVLATNSVVNRTLLLSMLQRSGRVGLIRNVLVNVGTKEVVVTMLSEDATAVVNFNCCYVVPPL